MSFIQDLGRQKKVSKTGDGWFGQKYQRSDLKTLPEDFLMNEGKNGGS